MVSAKSSGTFAYDQHAVPLPKGMAWRPGLVMRATLGSGWSD